MSFSSINCTINHIQPTAKLRLMLVQMSELELKVSNSQRYDNVGTVCPMSYRPRSIKLKHTQCRILKKINLENEEFNNSFFHILFFYTLN
jgi:hypothetical protein